jgi:hypothetical protein
MSLRRWASRPRRTGWRGRATAAVAAILAAALLSACGGATVSLSLKPGTVSACYRALPVARLALHDTSAVLQGVHRMPVDRLARTMPEITLPTGDDDTEVCAFAFKGTFVAGQVTGAPPQSQGRFAVVVVDSKRLDLLVSYVGTYLPVHFKHNVAAG